MDYRVISKVMAAGLLLTASSGIQAVTIDFEALNGSQAQGTDVFNPTSPYQEDDFTLSTGSGNVFAAWQDQGAGYTGSIALITSTNNSVHLVKDNGSEFTINSIDLWWAGFGSAPASDFIAQVLGTSASGSPLSQICTVSNVLSTVTTCQFSENFTVASLDLIQGNGLDTLYQFDNINISSVPVPASVWLFGSGLLGLIGIARKKRTFA